VSTTQTDKVLLFVSNVVVTGKGLFVVNIAAKLAEKFNYEITNYKRKDKVIFTLPRL
jgi:hypothetical protein